ncbi:MAG: HD domain-containing protein [Blautia sp.]|nr:HD domain-containing protein [Blautia sp.]
MNDWKWWKISLFVLLCILMDFLGKKFTAYYGLFFWFDSFGTVLCAYMGGPFCGAIVGMTGNLIYAMAARGIWVYALISIALSIVAGRAAEKGHLDTFFDMMTVSSVAAILCTALSVPLNYLYHNGNTGNIWGDGIRNFLSEQRFPGPLCMLAGEFALEFVDKVLTFMALYLMLKLYRAITKKNGKGTRNQADETEELSGTGSQSTSAAAMSLMLLVMLGAVLLCAHRCPAQDVSGGSVQERESLAEAAQMPPTVEAINYNDYVQTTYSSSNGLPCGEANDIAQTNDGILWVGTYAGLYRYNGREFRWMDGYESVRNVNCLYVDMEGRLWIGTNDNGLSIMINEKIVNVIDQAKGLSSNSVRSIIRSADGYYYIGTTSSMQVYTLNGGLKRVGTFPEVNYADLSTADKDGHVAMVTQDGRLFLLSGGRILSSVQLADQEEIFNSCGFDRDGRLLAGTSVNHIHIYDVSSGAFVETGVFTVGNLRNINDLYFMDNGDTVIVADNGINSVDTAGNMQEINVNEFNNSIDNMLVDYQGNLWFTSSRLGLLRLSPSSFKDVYTTIGLKNHVVNTVAHWQGNYYFGTDNGLDIVDDACSKEITNDLKQKLEGIRIRCIITDSAGDLWICTYGQGLMEVEPDGDIHYYNRDNGSFGNRARVVRELDDGTIIAGGDTGVSFIRDHEIIQTIGYQTGMIGSMILTVSQMSDGRILAGTDGDGIAVIEDGEVSQMLTRQDGLSSEVILRLVKDPQTEGVFIVTSNGLCYMDEEEKIRSLDAFPYFNNYDIWFKDSDMMFVGSSAGVYVVSRNELLSGEQDISYELLDSRKGLNASLTANSWNIDDGSGNLFLCCDKGVFIIDTDRYSSDSRSYRMKLSSYFLDGVRLRLEGNNPIRVSRGSARVELRPEIINYTIQDPYVGYFLEGFESQWQILQQSELDSIVYTNLPTGEYTLHLAVFDSNKKRILEERTYSLVKDMEIYDQRYFKIYMFLVSMAAVAWFTIYFVRTRLQKQLQIQRRELELNRKELEFTNKELSLRDKELAFTSRELDLTRKQAEMSDQTIVTIANAIDAKDARTSKHSENVAYYSGLIGERMGLSGDDLAYLKKAAHMHDIGKIGIPDAILNKPARLTNEEYAIMKSHTVNGGKILKDILIPHIVEGAMSHHERYDGKGYPNGLKGEEIPLYGRIIGVADAFDAMTANRVYRNKMNFDYVLGEMQGGRGTQFDPQIVDIFLQLIDEGVVRLDEIYAPSGGDDAEKTNGTLEQKDPAMTEGAAAKKQDAAITEGADAERKADPGESEGTSEGGSV